MDVVRRTLSKDSTDDARLAYLAVEAVFPTAMGEQEFCSPAMTVDQMSELAKKRGIDIKSIPEEPVPLWNTPGLRPSAAVEAVMTAPDYADLRKLVIMNGTIPITLIKSCKQKYKIKDMEQMLSMIDPPSVKRREYTDNLVEVYSWVLQIEETDR